MHLHIPTRCDARRPPCRSRGPCTVDFDFARDPQGKDQRGKAVCLRDIWPTQAEIQQVVGSCVKRDQFIAQYANVFEGSAEWKAIQTSGGELFNWSEKSTYIQNP